MFCIFMRGVCGCVYFIRERVGPERQQNHLTAFGGKMSNALSIHMYSL